MDELVQRHGVAITSLTSIGAVEQKYITASHQTSNNLWLTEANDPTQIAMFTIPGVLIKKNLLPELSNSHHM
jgi:hypothetical protein